MEISYKELAERADISPSYATQLLSDDPDQRRVPSLAMALKIYDKTGLQFGVLKGLPAGAIETLRANRQAA